MKNPIPVILNSEVKEKTTPMYYKNSMSCAAGACSGGAGYTTLHKDSWNETLVKCTSNRSTASNNNNYRSIASHNSVIEKFVFEFKVIKIKNKKALIIFNKVETISKFLTLVNSKKRINVIKQKNGKAIIDIEGINLKINQVYKAY